MPTIPKTIKLSALQKHNTTLDGVMLCGCTQNANPNNCIYQQFLDGWNFTPDVGNGQNRGEVFTPRFIVDKMIVQSGILPEQAVYQSIYKTQTKAESLKYIQQTVNEPAVGTANFTSTILWHKIHYAYQAALTKKVLDIPKYNLYITQAIASIYAYDIDCGNLQTTKNRLLKINNISSPENIKFWSGYLFQNIASFTRKTSAGKIIPSTNWNHKELTVINQVAKSLESAENNWGKQANKEGLITKLYKQHVGKHPTSALVSLWEEMLNENIKQFNGIMQHDTVKDDNLMDTFYCPGWQKVEWTVWDFQLNEDSVPEATSKTFKIRLAQQMYTNELKKLKDELQYLESLKKISGEDLSDIPVFVSNNDKKAYLLKKKEIEKLDHKYNFLKNKESFIAKTEVKINSQLPETLF